MASVHVELVSVERLIWSGDAQMVIARTTEGELGVLPGHAPLLGQLADAGVVRIVLEDGSEMPVAVHGGFLSVTDKGVSVLAELAEIGDEIDVDRAKAALERATSAPSDDEESTAEAARATVRLRAAGQLV